jgi:DNA-binding HxlR family transcriptional regulator
MTPQVGQPARGSTTGRPIMVLLDLLGRRWTLRILWELRDGNRRTFRALQQACGGPGPTSSPTPSPTIINTRLKELQAARLVDHAGGRGDGGYGLTALGRELLETFLPLHQWAERWAGDSDGAPNE